jgi:dolichol-phosphate mannosyltransferase
MEITMENDEAYSQVAVILPTYCEAENIAKLISDVEKTLKNPTILVIDDSSPDGTQEIVKKLKKTYKNLILLTRPEKMGLGTAITDGFKLLLSQPKNNIKHIITMDADYSHSPLEIPKLLGKAREGYDVVVGSRYCKGGNVEGWKINRLLISKTANKIARTIIKLPINDYTSGFRCYSKSYVEKAIKYLHSQTYEIQLETIRQAKLQNSKITEVPITFTNRKSGKSKLTFNEILAFSAYTIKVLCEKFSIQRKKSAFQPNQPA